MGYAASAGECTVVLLPRERGRRDRFKGLDGEANNATDCDLWNLFARFLGLPLYPKAKERKQRFGNSIGKACENKPKLHGSEQGLTSIDDRKPAVKETTVTLCDRLLESVLTAGVGRRAQQPEETGGPRFRCPAQDFLKRIAPLSADLAAHGRTRTLALQKTSRPVPSRSPHPQSPLHPGHRQTRSLQVRRGGRGGPRTRQFVRPGKTPPIHRSSNVQTSPATSH